MSSVPCRQLSPSTSAVSQSNPGALLELSEDLDALCRAGLLESFEDQKGVTRYRPVAAPMEEAA